ncbi:hypothetical protein IQ07DRAFT_684273 [Pyrenochaeta sp. DS3sAY3a]|nr:hypothetical protein IQ07DRAFT_684273 [Pyrenochaeta sp. DS3sAY3a]
MSTDENSPQKMVRIYIDNSNIYIQGSKITEKLYDPSWRYNADSLRTVLCENSRLTFSPIIDTQTCTNVYGSVPPPRGPWDAMVMRKINVHTYGRSPATGKEKMVDAKMVADITEDAMEDFYKGIQSEYIIVTGDADLRPATEKINKRGYRAHVWSWKLSFFNVYVPEVDDNGQERLSIHHLDNYRTQFEYRQKRSNPPYIEDMYLSAIGDKLKEAGFRPDTHRLLSWHSSINMAGIFRALNGDSDLISTYPIPKVWTILSLSGEQYLQPVNIAWLVQLCSNLTSARLQRVYGPLLPKAAVPSFHNASDDTMALYFIYERLIKEPRSWYEKMTAI